MYYYLYKIFCETNFLSKKKSDIPKKMGLYYLGSLITLQCTYLLTVNIEGSVFGTLSYTQVCITTWSPFGLK